MTNKKRRVILITDGDEIARQTVEIIAQKMGGRCISASAGNPTPLNGAELVDLIRQADHDPVFVMLDDKGSRGQGRGEKALEYICKHQNIEILGVVAVASNTTGTNGIEVDLSVTKKGTITNHAVDKSGNVNVTSVLEGDTVDILNKLCIPIVVGTGDTGKMDGADAPGKQSPVTAKAIAEILNRSGFDVHY